MVALTDIQASNSRIASSLPPGLVAVFVGGTNGVGETTLKAFAKHARQPRVYFIGRSHEAGDRIRKECKALNAKGELTFIKAECSLIRNVDDVCRDIESREKEINILFLTTGTLVFQTKTAEELHTAVALTYYCRTRFIINLLPLLQQATSLRRVVTVFAGGKEGQIYPNDFQGWKVPMMNGRGHNSSLVTLGLEAIAQKAPSVTFIHEFPARVKSGIARGVNRFVLAGMKAVFSVIGPPPQIPVEESGERHLFLATSARYPANEGSGNVNDFAGVPLADGVGVARRTSGEAEKGGAVYSIDWDGESAGVKVEELLAGMRGEGMVERVWTHTEGEYKRITGSVDLV